MTDLLGLKRKCNIQNQWPAIVVGENAFPILKSPISLESLLVPVLSTALLVVQSTGDTDHCSRMGLFIGKHQELNRVCPNMGLFKIAIVFIYELQPLNALPWTAKNSLHLQSILSEAAHCPSSWAHRLTRCPNSWLILQEDPWHSWPSRNHPSEDRRTRAAIGWLVALRPAGTERVALLCASLGAVLRFRSVHPVRLVDVPNVGPHVGWFPNGVRSLRS